MTRNQRRVERFAQRIATVFDEVEELKQGRPPDTAIQRPVNVFESGVGLTDSVSSRSSTDPYFSYDDPDRGYDFSDYEP